jgi:hypothetical protein
VPDQIALAFRLGGGWTRIRSAKLTVKADQRQPWAKLARGSSGHGTRRTFSGEKEDKRAAGVVLESVAG